MEMSGQLHAPIALPLNPLDRRLGGPQSWYRHSGEVKWNIPTLPGIESRSSNPVALSLLYWLRFRGCYQLGRRMVVMCPELQSAEVANVAALP
jgi:hypothetical protein